LGAYSHSQSAFSCGDAAIPATSSQAQLICKTNKQLGKQSQIEPTNIVAFYDLRNFMRPHEIMREKTTNGHMVPTPATELCAQRIG